MNSIKFLQMEKHINMFVSLIVTKMQKTMIKKSRKQKQSLLLPLLVHLQKKKIPKYTINYSINYAIFTRIAYIQHVISAKSKNVKSPAKNVPPGENQRILVRTRTIISQPNQNSKSVAS